VQSLIEEQVNKYRMTYILNSLGSIIQIIDILIVIGGRMSPNAPHTPFLFYPFFKYRRFHVQNSNIRHSAVSFY
jgi:hypothetical protein